MNTPGKPRTCDYKGKKCDKPPKVKVYDEGKYKYYCTEHADVLLKKIVGERRTGTH